MEFLVAEGIPAKRIRLSVAAANEPVRLATDKTARQSNNRVEVFLVNEFTESHDGTEDQRLQRSAAPTIN